MQLVKFSNALKPSSRTVKVLNQHKLASSVSSRNEVGNTVLGGSFVTYNTDQLKENGNHAIRRNVWMGRMKGLSTFKKEK